jgi:hypothetical protein
LGSDPTAQIEVFVVVRNITVPVDFAIVGKLLSNGLPGWAWQITTIVII